MLFNEVLHFELLLRLLGQSAQLATDFEQAHDFAYVVSLVVVVTVLLRDHKGECFLDPLDPYPEVKEGHVKVEKLL